MDKPGEERWEASGILATFYFHTWVVFQGMKVHWTGHCDPCAFMYVYYAVIKGKNKIK